MMLLSLLGLPLLGHSSERQEATLPVGHLAVQHHLTPHHYMLLVWQAASSSSSQDKHCSFCKCNQMQQYQCMVRHKWQVLQALLPVSRQ
jgi:hypothetical protein